MIRIATDASPFLSNFAFADPEKSEIVRRQQEAETIAREREEQEQREEAEKARIAAETERANIWNFLDRFVDEIKSGKRLNGNNRYTAGSCKAWSSFIFLVGCYTCQRVSDYNNIQPEDFTTTAKGTPIIRLVQQKTRNEVKIPIMNPNLEAICKKYEYNLPSVVDQILNRLHKGDTERPLREGACPAQWHYQYVPLPQIHHRTDDARQRPQDTKDLHGLHQTLIR